MKQLTANDFPEGSLREIANELGIEAATGLWQKFPGCQLYIPIASELKVRQHILQHYNGSNTKALARVLGVSERTIYHYLATKTPVSDNQLSLQITTP